MELTRKARRKIEDLEEMLAEVQETLDDQAGDEPESALGEDIRAATDEIKLDIGAVKSEVADIRRLLKDIPDGAVLGAIKKLTDKVSTMETSIRQVTTWEASARESADRMTHVASSLVALDRVQEYAARSVYVVKHKNAPSGDYTAIFSGSGAGMAMAKELAAAAKTKGYIVCLGIWQGAVKIGDAVE